MKLDKIHEDSRGTIEILTGDLRSCHEITIFRTNRGYARGGCIHSQSKEHLIVVEGKIRYVCKINGAERQVILDAGESITIGPNVAHYFEALTDCLVMEFGPTAEEKNARDEDYRNLVVERNSQI